MRTFTSIPCHACRILLKRIVQTVLNYVDVYQRNGAVDYQPVPFVPGYEGVGTVRLTGPGVTAFPIGTRVAWINVPGSYAQQLVLPADRARAIVETGVRGVEKRRKKAVAIEGECCFSR
jgi:NADPH:quinone reductase-like Zn-dependent oxidoreductase